MNLPCVCACVWSWTVVLCSVNTAAVSVALSHCVRMALCVGGWVDSCFKTAMCV